MPAARASALLLLLPALAGLALAGGGPAPCPAASPTTFVQNDAGSGRDAGPDRASAVVPRPGADGYAWGHLDGFLEYGVPDMNDWYVMDLSPGPRSITFSLRALMKVVEPTAQPPTIFYIAVYRDGEDVTLYDAPSWEPPFTYHSPGSERLYVHILAHQLSAVHACGEAAQPASVGALPAAPQGYRVQLACAPSC